MTLNNLIEGRRFEWVIAMSMIGLAIETYGWPRTLEFSAFTDILRIVSSPFVATFMLVVGGARIILLMMNGQSFYGIHIGPTMRSIVAVLCAVMWAQFSIALFQLSMTQERPSPGLPFWIMLTLGELDVAYRTVRNDRRDH